MATAKKAAEKPAKTKPATTSLKAPASAKPKIAATAGSEKKAVEVKASKATAKPSQTRKSAAADAKPSLTPEQRRFYVEVAAYYIAERRGFTGGNTVDDWTAAEAEIDRLLREGVLRP